MFIEMMGLSLPACSHFHCYLYPRNLLAQDCVAALAFCADKERLFHRVRYRMAKCAQIGPIACAKA